MNLCVARAITGSVCPLMCKIQHEKWVSRKGMKNFFSFLSSPLSLSKAMKPKDRSPSVILNFSRLSHQHIKFLLFRSFSHLRRRFAWRFSKRNYSRNFPTRKGLFATKLKLEALREWETFHPAIHSARRMTRQKQECGEVKCWSLGKLKIIILNKQKKSRLSEIHIAGWGEFVSDV